jgi:phospholipid N-methyltransferase
MKKNKHKNFYPEKVTEVFDGADFHIKYCLSFIKKYLSGNTLEVGAGCGSFTRHYYKNKKILSITMTEKDKANILTLSKKFKNNKIMKVSNKGVSKLKKNFDVILYLHVLEHIKNDFLEVRLAIKKLKKNGFLVILAPAHNKMYSNLDKLVGHFRRYELVFFNKKIKSLKSLNLIELKFLDSAGYVLYFLNRLLFKKEKYPSKFKIFIWDKIFTPVSFIMDFIFRYKIGKCILGVYKKN